MSLELLTWALKVKPANRKPIKPSSRFVLVVMATWSADGLSWCSNYTLCEATSYNEKTVRRAVQELVECNLIEPTGDCVGQTGQIRVYKLLKNKNELLKGGLKGGVKAGHKGGHFDRKDSLNRDTYNKDNKDNNIYKTSSLSKSTSYLNFKDYYFVATDDKLISEATRLGVIYDGYNVPSLLDKVCKASGIKTPTDGQYFLIKKEYNDLQNSFYG